MRKLFQQIVSIIVQLNPNKHDFKSNRLKKFYKIGPLENFTKFK